MPTGMRASAIPLAASMTAMLAEAAWLTKMRSEGGAAACPAHAAHAAHAAAIAVIDDARRRVIPRLEGGQAGCCAAVRTLARPARAARALRSRAGPGQLPIKGFDGLPVARAPPGQALGLHPLASEGGLPWKRRDAPHP